ncbi:LysR family transcriptional regulator [Allokutzneria sp. A3M-2-11 16]|uniref:LysR family transcriptional regulator n=1 Tax=Allokutzneria sp. A3M-2-11 16 TaxID=2962043 RepID=UPI0020B86FD2|nr:LysR family transcriptional regulator [Allokutzneria sp. A3M-2-11 16]MCP3802355.1 LysR family transcriptional regulator [Allokutzneria sp. A3M-2-11 16]
MELDLGAVRAFAVVAEERHFGEAASRLGLSQQAVSKRVARLEDDLATTLLHRSRGSGTNLTSDGEAFLPHARALLTVADQAVAALRARRRPLRIDVLHTWLASTELVREFYQSTGVEVEIVTSQGLRDAGPALAERSVDAAFARVTGALDESIAHHPAYLEPLHLLVGRKHPLARRRSVTVAELAGGTAWMPDNQPGSEWADYYEALEEELGIGIDTSGPHFGFDHLLEELGGSPDWFSFAAERMRVPWYPDVVQIPIVRPIPVYPWSLLVNRHHPHPALSRLVRHVEENFTPLDPARHWVPPADRASFS